MHFYNGNIEIFTKVDWDYSDILLQKRHQGRKVGRETERQDILVRLKCKLKIIAISYFV